MSDVIVNPDNVNPHFQRPEEFGLTTIVKNDSVANTDGNAE